MTTAALTAPRGPAASTAAAHAADAADAAEEAAAASADAARALRQVFGRYATGVAVVTAAGADGRPVGMTINSFVSLSLAPPLVSWGLGERSPSRAVFEQAPCFGISVLAHGQQALAQQLATPGLADKFSGVPLCDGGQGVPRIAGALAWLLCRRVQQIPLGDHLLFVGEVLASEGGEGAPLLFHRGRFAALQA